VRVLDKNQIKGLKLWDAVALLIDNNGSPYYRLRLIGCAYREEPMGLRARKRSNTADIKKSRPLLCRHHGLNPPGATATELNE
jgi:hypothetical protein